MQGERPMARDNRTLGKFHLDGIPAAPRGMPQIEVSFDIDANGIVNVQAKDKGTGKEQKITITASSGLTKDEVDRMMRDAESHADEDKQRREDVETRNRADQSVYSAEKFLKESGDKLDAADRLAIESAINDLKNALDASEPKRIAKTLDALMQAQQKAAERLYQSAAPPSAAASDETASAGARRSEGDGQADDVIDAEIVDEKK
jgi:molecular chaperone DnaK